MLLKKCCHHYRTCKLIVYVVENTLIVLVQKMIKMCWKQKSNKKVFQVKLILNFSYTKHYKTCWHIVWSAKKIQKM